MTTNSTGGISIFDLKDLRSLQTSFSHSRFSDFVPTHVVRINLPIDVPQAIILQRIVDANQWVFEHSWLHAASKPPFYFFDDENLAMQFYLIFG